jgi:hypothetical protein
MAMFNPTSVWREHKFVRLEPFNGRQYYVDETVCTVHIVPIFCGDRYASDVGRFAGSCLQMTQSLGRDFIKHKNIGSYMPHTLYKLHVWRKENTEILQTFLQTIWRLYRLLTEMKTLGQ